MVEDWTIASVAGGGGGFLSLRAFDPCHGGGEAIAAPGYRLDAAALLSVFVQDAAQRRNLDGQVAFDHCPGPDRLNDRIL